MLKVKDFHINKGSRKCLFQKVQQTIEDIRDTITLPKYYY
uniref:Uncharacterized protein n=1 Tax=Arundo donax TaxID=35708 RepID=A0A0A9GVN5_ARUDO